MSEDASEDAKPVRRTLKLPPVRPVYRQDVAGLGPLEFWPVSVTAALALETLAAGSKPTPAQFLDHLILATARRKSGDAEADTLQGSDAPANPTPESLTKEDVALITPDDRRTLAAGLLEGHRFHQNAVLKTTPNDAGETVSKFDGYETVTPREPDETDEAYLQRAYDAQAERHAAKWREITKDVASQVSGLSAGMKAALGPGIMANFEDSWLLGQQLSAMSGTHSKILDGLKTRSSAADRIAELGRGLGGPFDAFSPRTEPRSPIASVPRAPIIDLPPNPVHKTNSLLEELGERIEAMSAIAQSTATMQQSLNDVARTAVTEFATGAEDSKAATDLGLKISLGALVVGAVSAILAAAAIWIGVEASGEAARNAEIQASAEAALHREEMDLRTRELTANERLADELRRARVSAARQAASGRSGRESPKA